MLISQTKIESSYTNIREKSEMFRAWQEMKPKDPLVDSLMSISVQM